jgi:hypothetical protein
MLQFKISSSTFVANYEFSNFKHFFRKTYILNVLFFRCLYIVIKYYHSAKFVFVMPQEAQARFARARLCLPYNVGRKETLRPK